MSRAGLFSTDTSCGEPHVGTAGAPFGVHVTNIMSSAPVEVRFPYETVISPSGRTCTKLKSALGSPVLITIGLLQLSLGLVHALSKMLEPGRTSSVTTVYRSPAPVAELVWRGSTAMCGDDRT